MTRAPIIAITAIITLCAFLAGRVSAHPAWGIVVDRNNQIYFSDLETIWKVDARGKLTVFRAGVSGRHAHELSIGEDGNLYGADNSYEPSTRRFFSAVWKMTPAGGARRSPLARRPGEPAVVSTRRRTGSPHVYRSRHARDAFVLPGVHPARCRELKLAFHAINLRPRGVERGMLGQGASRGF